MPQDRTLLMVDIVDSTATTSALGEAAAVAFWQQHDRRSRELLRKWRGQEAARGDGFVAWFDTLSDGVSFAAAYHRLLATLQPAVRARAGLHLGPLDLQANGEDDVALGARALEVQGLAKAITARLMTLAGSGQTLTTAAAAQALAASPWPLQSHGHWRFKGFDEPLEVFEIGTDGAPMLPPADADKVHRVLQRDGQWVGLAEVPNNLPAEPDGWVGRRADLRLLAQRFDAGTRLVTLLGIGGMGKTRLALRFGWGWRGDHPGGVFFCDLAPATNADGILLAVAQALDVPLGRDPVAQLGHAIAGRGRVLLILDNFEQVQRHAQATLAHWLARAPAARFLATSRERLMLSGEQVLALDPLPATDGAALFCQRAAAQAASVAADDPNVLALVKLVDGLPLAIELAAARAHVLPPAELLARMDQRFRLLAGPSQGRPDRQTTLRATLDWSWDLLGAAERSTLAQLSVFEGAFGLTAAEAVLDLDACGGSDWPLDLIQSLVDKSLVRCTAGGRFDLLRSVQHYAGERLQDAGSFPASGATLAAATRRRHWEHFATLDETMISVGPVVDLDNLVHACQGAVAGGDGAAAAACLGLAWVCLKRRGPFQAAVTLADRVRTMPGLLPAHRARLESVAGAALMTMGDLGAAAAAAQRGLAENSDEAAVVARLHCVVAETSFRRSDSETAAAHLALAEQAANQPGVDVAARCTVLNTIGYWAADSHRFAEARQAYEAGLVLARAAADRRWEGGLLGNIGVLHYGQGRLDESCEAYEQALQLAERTGDRRWEANAHCNLGLVYAEQGRADPAARELGLALEMAREMGNPRVEANVLCNLGLLAESRGDLAGAVQQFELSVDAAATIGDRRLEAQARAYLGQTLLQFGRPAQDCLAPCDALLAGSDDPLSWGLVWCSRSQLAHRTGDGDWAETCLDRARRYLEQSDLGPNSDLAKRIAVAAAGLAAR